VFSSVLFITTSHDTPFISQIHKIAIVEVYRTKPKSEESNTRKHG